MGNAGLLQFFGNNDLTTLEWVSKRLGKSNIMQISRRDIGGAGGRRLSGQSKQIQTVELMTPDEIAKFFSRQSGAQLIIWPGADPIAMDRVPYYDDAFFAGTFDP
jgi:type IV secretion system protein VirD4